MRAFLAAIIERGAGALCPIGSKDIARSSGDVWGCCYERGHRCSVPEGKLWIRVHPLLTDR